MQIRYTIEEIKKVYDTGDSPVLVTCDDLEDYVCKHRHAEKLLYEYLASEFLKLWRIPTPETCFIKVNTENHVPQRFWRMVRPNFFEKDCFGSLNLHQSIEMNETACISEANKIKNRLDLLRIALFDIWLANEDRTFNNYNLLLVPLTSSNYSLYAIDHGACFNSGALKSVGSLSTLTQDETLLNTPLATLLFKNSNKINSYAEQILAEFSQNVQACSDKLDEILTFVPSSWQLDLQLERSLLVNNIFSEKWIETVKATFREYVQIYLK